MDNFEQTLRNLTHGKSFAAGAEWTVRYVSKHGDEFAGKKLRFEISETTNGQLRRVDMEVVASDVVTFYEFNSVQNFPDVDVFKAQFEKDLLNGKASELTQIK